jgi:FtsH-binding integral membrane protein
VTSLVISFTAVGFLILLPIPFVRDGRLRRSLAVMALLVFGLLAITVALQLPRHPALSFGIFTGLIGLFWVAGRFEGR